MRLLLVELRRLSARRFFRWGTLAVLVGTLALTALTAVQSSPPSAADRAAAARQAEQAAPLAAADRARCEQAKADAATSGTPSPEFPADFRCAAITPPRAEDFLSVYEFDFRGEMRDRTLVLVAVLAMFGFVLGATLVGAEWHHGTMGTLLLFEPRRLRVFTAKALALLIGAGVASLLALAVSTAAHYAVGSTRGRIGELTAGWQVSLGLLAGRGLLFVGASALIGFAIAYTLRHTAAALGVALGYAVLAELGLRAWSVRTAVGLFTTNAAAWLQDGTEVFVYDCSPTGGECTSDTLSVPLWQGGLVVGGLALVLVVVAALVFRRREVA